MSWCAKDHPLRCRQQPVSGIGVLAAPGHVKGDPSNPDSQGFLCIRGQASQGIFGSPNRLLHPVIRDRRGDDFRQASWDEALDRIATAVAASPPESTALWPGHGTFTTNYGTRISAQLLMRFANFHGSQCWRRP